MKPLRKLALVILGIILFYSLNILPSRFNSLSAKSNLAEQREVLMSSNKDKQPSLSVSSPNCIEANNINEITKLSAFELLDNGDKCYKENKHEIARQWYKQAKKPFFEGKNTEIKELIYDEDELSGSGKRMWEKYDYYKDKPKLSSGRFSALYSLIRSDSNFIPGYFALREAYRAEPDWCNLKEKPGNRTICEGNPHNSLETMARAVSRYPNDANLVKVYIEELVEGENFLEASIEARMFAQFESDNPKTKEISDKADEYLALYKKKINSELIAQSAIACAITIATNSDPQKCGIITYLLQGENKIGDKQVELLKQQLSLNDNPEVNNYVRGIAESLIPLFGRSDLKYEVYVVNNVSLNAFALPGGKIFINTGAILGTESQAELAGVMAHEIAHAVYSHGYRGLANSVLLGSILDMFQKTGSSYGSLNNALGNGLALLNLDYSRRMETESDILGLRVLDKAGYAADGLSDFMATIEKQSATKRQQQNQGNSLIPLEWYSTHPLPENRVRYLQELIEINGYNRYGFEGVRNHKNIQNLLRG